MTPLLLEDNNLLLEQLDSSSPSDYVVLPDETSIQIRQYWCDINDGTEMSVPADLIRSNTIPIPDIMFQTDLDYQFLSTDTLSFPKIDSYRVCMFGPKMIFGLTNDAGCVGAITFTAIYQLGYVDIIVPILVNYEHDLLGVSTLCVTKPKWSKNFPEELYDAFLSIAFYMLADWYSVQILLLHPKIKNVFKKGKNVKIKDPAIKKQTNGKRITRYIKQHTITEEAINNELSTCRDGINRKTMAWWVIGHYRTYRNGTKTFIQGYWKGPLRNTKRNHDEGRERIIDPYGYGGDAVDA